MRRLNLLPPAEKTELKLLRLYLAIKELIFLMLIGLIAIAIILMLAKHNLQLQLAQIVSDTVQTSGLNFSNQDVRMFKDQLIRIQQIQEGFRPWTKLFPKLLTLLPAGVALEQLSIDVAGALELKVVAATRPDLLQFRDNLNDSGFLVEPLKIGVEDLLKPRNLTQTLKLKANVTNLIE